MEFKDINLSATFNLEFVDSIVFDVNKCNKIINDTIDSVAPHLHGLDVKTKTITIIGSLKKFPQEDRVEIHNMLCDMDDLTLIRSMDACLVPAHEFKVKDVVANFYRQGIIIVFNIIFLD